MQQAHDTSQKRAPSSPDQRFAVILANEQSGKFTRESSQLDETAEFLRQEGWRVDLRYSTSIEEAQQHAREAVQQRADILVAVGGDGTINSLIQELAGSETALGVIPSGTFNVWARETGIPLDVAGARDVLVHGQTRRIDLGRVHDRYFLLMAGIGFGGIVTYAVKKEGLKRLGVLGYLLTGLRLALGFDSFRAELTIDGKRERTHALQIVVGNTRLYGSLLQFTWRAKVDDGLLDVCVLRAARKFERVVLMLDFLLQRNKRRKWVTYRTCRSIEINTRKPVNFQIDGEPVGHTPASFTIVPGALKVVVPQQTAEAIFVDADQKRKPLL